MHDIINYKEYSVSSCYCYSHTIQTIYNCHINMPEYIASLLVQGYGLNLSCLHAMIIVSSLATI